ncbi:MAG TPA: anti-sigma factor [Sporichthyaceae bacterium]|jgi:anti-sigma-K factor RskA
MTDLHALSGAYVVGALNDAELAEFTDHLDTCGQCAVEVRELLETTALLGIAAAHPAPPALRAAVMKEIGRTRQLPPVVVSLESHARKRGSTLRRWSLTAAACLAVFTIGLGAYAGQLQHENANLRHRGDQIAALETAADARTITGAGGAATAMVTMSRTAHTMEFLSSGLAMHKGRTYQLWLIGPNGPRSAGVFNTANGKHAPRLFEGPGDATALAVTEEPAGGSAQPTTHPLITMALPTA